MFLRLANRCGSLSEEITKKNAVIQSYNLNTPSILYAGNGLFLSSNPQKDYRRTLSICTIQ